MERTDYVALCGGLGNQLFQYSFARWLEDGRNRAVRLDLSWRSPRGFPLLELPAAESLGVLDRVAPWTARLRGPGNSPSNLARATFGPRRIERHMSSAGPAKVPAGPAWWYGYWQRTEWVRPALPHLRELLGVPEPRAQTIGVHIRRGDFVGLGADLSVGWYASAIGAVQERLNDSAEVVLVSDDPDWCRRTLSPEVQGEVSIAPPASALADLQFLSSCSALVLSRSSFSWWAANLAAGPMVAAPSPMLDAADPAASWNPDWISVAD